MNNILSTKASTFEKINRRARQLCIIIVCTFVITQTNAFTVENLRTANKIKQPEGTKGLSGPVAEPPRYLRQINGYDQLRRNSE